MKSMKLAASAAGLAALVAYMGIPIDVKKIVVFALGAIGFAAASYHILRYGPLIERFASPTRHAPDDTDRVSPYADAPAFMEEERLMEGNRHA